MTADEAALLAAICTHPADDLPRLVYADWLDEHGEPERAEFIRAQVELARLETAVESQRQNAVAGGCCDRFADNKACDCLNTPVMDALRQRERELLVAARDLAGHAWARGLFPDFSGVEIGHPRLLWGTGDGVIRADFRRGFIEAIRRCPAVAWLAHGDAVRRLHPVERVRLTTSPQWEAGTAAFRLIGDPKKAAGSITFERALAEQHPDDGDDLLPAVIRCRWPGVAFELP